MAAIPPKIPSVVFMLIFYQCPVVSRCVHINVPILSVKVRTQPLNRLDYRLRPAIKQCPKTETRSK
jgi:hypothetical protein